MIDGGAGTDRLEADIGNSQKFAVSLHTTSVEQFAVRAQADNTNDSNDNNMDNNVQIDAERMDGTNWYESNNSRADVVIEDVRIERTEAYNSASNQITKDITVAMVSTDAGDVDLDVYFDQHSLVAQDGQTKNSITLSVSNQVEATDFDAAKPLDNIPYTDVTFLVNGSSVKLNLDLTNVDTYDQMWTAIQNGFNDAKAGAYSSLLANVTITRSVGTDDFISKDGIARVADEYVLNIENGTITPAVTGWNAAGGLPSTNAFGANVSQGDSSTTSNLITSTIVLDDVGRGSMGGDLVIGGMSTGDTSTSKGVEQFDIFVDRDSKLQNITSTANTLEEVYVKNRDHFADKNTTAVGSLTVTGSINNETTVVADDETGVDSKTTIDAYGFNDVRVFDASEMKGSVNITAILSKDVVEKYMNLGDTASDNSADNAEFTYKLGTAADKLELTIAKDNLAAAGTTTREDFSLSIAGNGGDDTITTIIGDGKGIDTDAWYINSKINSNLVINAGSGNDTVTTTGAGDFKINLGAGNDTVYTDNSGAKAAWVVGAEAGSTNINDLDAQTTGAFGTQFLVNGKLTVSLADVVGTTNADSVSAANYVSGYEVTVDVPTGSNYATTQLHINQAIKKAINEDAVLSKLLVAKDGPANTLVITSLIDGLMVANNLEITVDSADVNSIAYTATEQASILAAYKAYSNNSAATQANAQTANAAAVTASAAVNGIGVDGAILGTSSSESVTIGGAATADGVITTFIGGTAYGYTVTSGDTAAQIADGMAAFLSAKGITAISDGTSLVTITTSELVSWTSTAAGAGVTDNGVATTTLTGSTSIATSDNIITGEAGNDVIVLGTGAESNDTLVFSGNFGTDTIVNFSTTADSAIANDKLDFTAYLTSKTSVSGSADSAVYAAIAVETTLTNITANDVVLTTFSIVSAIDGSATNTFANLTDAQMLVALNEANVFQVDTTASIYGATAKAVIMVENDANKGEYKIYDVTYTEPTAANDADNFTSAKLVGTIDFGETLNTFATADLTQHA